MPDRTDQRPPRATDEAGPARLYALAAGVFLSLLGVLGFFYDAGFDTGTKLAADDIAGIIVVNGWLNVIYLASGLLALAFAPRHARRRWWLRCRTMTRAATRPSSARRSRRATSWRGRSA